MKTLRLAGIDGDAVDLTQAATESLAARLGGSLLLPEDPRFDAAVRIWNRTVQHRPALVVQPSGPRDVQEAVRFARDLGVQMSVKGGGHHIAGLSLSDGGMTLDMSRLRTVAVDPDRRIAGVGAGCRLGDVDRATQEHGLATVLGSVSETGVAGLTLGGGFGYLTRRFGWTVDNLLEVEIVTADGEVRRAAGDENGDLFWALRGGGGNFGVVTRFTFRLHRLGPAVTGGILLWDAEQSEEVAELYGQVTETSSDELTLMLVMRLAPPAPFVPEQWRGRPVIGLVVCHSGAAEDAARELAPIRSTGKPIVDTVGPVTYDELQSMLDSTQADGMHNYWKSEFLPRTSSELLRAFRHHASKITSPFSQAILFQLGGALAAYSPPATPFAHRDAAHIFFAAGCWAPDDDRTAQHMAWARSAWQAVRPHSTGGNYVNVQTGDEDEVRVGEAYGANLDRLARVKAAYDPDNFFRLNRNIPPRTERSGALGTTRR